MRLSIFYIGVGILSAMITLVIAKPTVERRIQHETVYYICQVSRTSNGVAENTCGDMQSLYGIEYLCQERNSRADNTCWTEDNPSIGQELR